MSPKGVRTTPLKTGPDVKRSLMEDKLPDDSPADSESGMYCEYVCVCVLYVKVCLYWHVDLDVRQPTYI